MVDDPHSAADAEEFNRVSFFQLLDDRHELAQRFDKRRRLENLRPDVRLDSADLQMRQLCRLGINPENTVDPDAELVVALAGRNVFVGLGIDIRIDPQGHRRPLAQCPRHLVDEFQFRLGLHIEGINTLLEGIFDFLPRLAHPGKGTRARLPAGLEHAEKFPARHDVESRPLAGEQIEHRKI